MKKELLVFSTFLLGIVEVVSAEEGSSMKRHFTNRGSNPFTKDDGMTIELPLPLKVGPPRRVDLSGMSPIVERVVDRKTLAEALKKAEAKRAHFSTQRKETQGAAEQLRGTVVPGSSIQRKYVPPVETHGTTFVDTLKNGK